jgi:site-specific DNA-methyltransferase (adenine-specific)
LKIEKRNIDLIKPYWRNPRKNENAVEAVKESIKRYGYTQPIVVDKDNVIIAGHTRYKALRQLGYKNIAVVLLDIDEDKAKQYRIADNKTAEMSEWDDDLLMYELREIEELEDMTIFFDDGELDSLLDIRDEDYDFDDDFDEEERREELEEEARATVVASLGTDVDKEDEEVQEQIEEKVEAQVNEEMKEDIREKMKEENERIKEREKEMKNQFKERTEDREDDYIEIQCPHCDEKYILSRSELLRANKVRRTV